MFKGHPKGLYALALANTGERCGYYTMLAIFVLFLQAKFGYNEAQAGHIYGIFLGCVYFMPLIGGMLADRFGYGKMVKSGIVVMFLGYLLLAVPMATETAKITMFSALALIAIGTGLFKGNLQVMVGNLYDEAKYSAFRDNGFSLFYMAINIGSMFAPITATKVTDLFLGKAGFSYVPQIPSLAHQYLDGTITADALSSFEALAVQQGGNVNDLLFIVFQGPLVQLGNVSMTMIEELDDDSSQILLTIEDVLEVKEFHQQVAVILILEGGQLLDAA